MNTIKSKTQNNNAIKSILLLCFVAFGLVSCDNDDDNPPPIDEEEVITTMNVTLSGAGSTITLQSQDLDGDGPNAPVITVSGNLIANTTYNGSLELLNETETPTEDITEEIEEEDEEHQFFFTATGAITGVDYEDLDGNGNPVGLSFTLSTGDAGNGTLQITLRHELKKPNDGTLADAGGETDIAQTFNLTVE
ncbi:type 1 periplasmic binding fold superfamily protein [Maribacter sp. 4G9]|uniref:type 1 periplasmic binding fold superfamily protein n=1 Tax=Maribacter sp. 4G9 TaxID=1889777 RepID=UPI000C583743|nr:type 1 periplasmic binding fold superfamily protein [Maribacter sp. 4G9]PIB38084.1 type 1 periplasmic binding fold superfamily protein [Maribacter sp. 4G9]